MLRAVGEELREARLQGSLTQGELGAAVGVSASAISRIERGESPHAAFETLARLGVALGLDIVLRAYPNGDAVRDAAQLALLARFRASLAAGLRHRAEFPLGIPGDRRAWDEVIDGLGWWLPVEAESRLRDVQALHRRIGLKCRDGGADCVLLLVADTRHNRHVLRMYSAEFAAAFPVPGRVALASLRAGHRPGGSAVVLL